MLIFLVDEELVSSQRTRKYYLLKVGKSPGMSLKGKVKGMTWGISQTNFDTRKVTEKAV